MGDQPIVQNFPTAACLQPAKDRPLWPTLCVRLQRRLDPAFDLTTVVVQVLFTRTQTEEGQVVWVHV
jgi:hypothetical protein